MAKRTIITGENKKYFKNNYFEVLQGNVPGMYLQDDIDSFGSQQPLADLALNSQIKIALNFNTIFNVSATTEGSSLSVFSGIAAYFIKQNNPIKLDTFDFDRLLLKPLGVRLSDFQTSAQFKTFIDESFIPNTQLNNPNYLFGLGNKELAHDFLIQNLSWLYFLNTSSNGNLAYSPSSFVSEILINKIYNGESIVTVDAMKGLNTFLWKNQGVCSLFSEILPSIFLSGTNNYTSGTQNLDKYLTLIEIIFSPLYADETDGRVQRTFDDFISTQTFLDTFTPYGAFHKLLEGMAYGIYDINAEIESLNFLYSIDDCPDQYLPYLAELIGWQLIGPNTEKWRVQLRNAVQIYKLKGTKKCLDLVINTLYGDGQSTPLSSVEELWESYIPNMLYYALNVETSAFNDFRTWTRERANSYGVSDYSEINMDLNIRYYIDHIIRTAVIANPDLFFIGNKPFDLSDPSFRFYYRNKINDIPPFELEKYYRYCQINDDFLQYLYERLICVGVRETFATSALQYIDVNIRGITRASPINGWLFFTRENYLPPNHEKVLENFENNKYKFISLWNGKSSHFSITINSNAYDFDEDSYLPNTSRGIRTIGEVVKLFTPAKAIPLIDTTNDLVDETVGNDLNCITLNYPIDDLSQSSLNNFDSSSMNMTSLNRQFLRVDVDSISDAPFEVTTVTTNIKRNSLRRRNLQNLIEKDGWYSRTGFNMPPYNAELPNNLYIPLGYIPSAGCFASISSYNDIPEIYQRCENLNSNSQFYGYDVSNTFPCRGRIFEISSCNSYSKRADCHPIVPVIHSTIQKRSKEVAASALENFNFYFTYSLSSDFMDLSTSLSNASAGPDNISDFFNFSFGRYVHDAYKNYVVNFNGHPLDETLLDLSGGFDFFSHTYGPGLYNSLFSVNGSAANNYPELITSSFSNVVVLNNNSNSGIFGPSATASGTYIASTLSSLYVDTYEFRNPHLLSAIELIIPSGAVNYNSFTIFDIAESDWLGNELITLEKNRSLLLRQYGFVGLPRFKFNLATYNPLEYLSPEHEFAFNIKSYIARLGENTLGGGSIGVWIHTEPENGYFWSYSKDGSWKIDSTSNFNLATVQSHAHVVSFPLEKKPSQEERVCVFDTGTPVIFPNEFKDFEVKFNTYNPPICIPNYYYDVNGQVHRTNQKYVLEIFMFPTNIENMFAVFDSVSLVDKTLNTFVSEYTPKQVLEIFRFFKEISFDRASRVHTITSGTFETSGGSRLNYRIHPESGTFTKDATFGNYTNIDFTK